MSTEDKKLTLKDINCDFAILVDVGTGWFSNLHHKGKNYDIRDIDRCEFISNIYSRAPLNNFFYDGDYPPYQAWSISEKESNRILRLLELRKGYEEYLKLATYNI